MEPDRVAGRTLTSVEGSPIGRILELPVTGIPQQLVVGQLACLAINPGSRFEPASCSPGHIEVDLSIEVVICQRNPGGFHLSFFQNLLPGAGLEFFPRHPDQKGGQVTALRDVLKKATVQIAVEAVAIRVMGNAVDEILPAVAIQIDKSRKPPSQVATYAQGLRPFPEQSPRLANKKA